MGRRRRIHAVSPGAGAPLRASAAAAVLSNAALGLTAAGVAMLWRIPLCTARSAGAEVAREITVVIPARNEEGSLPRLLESLTRQSVAPRRIVVVDDHSEDGTARCARAFGVRVIQPPDKPGGWTGKTWACLHGARRADTEYLLFLDADVWLDADGLVRLGTAMAEGRGVVSVQPYHVVRTFTEQFSAFFHIMAMGGIGAFTVLGDRVRPAGAFGPCLLCSRDDYFAVGGHERVRGSVLENLSLGRVFAEAGLPVRLYGGRGTLNMRMYPGGIGTVVDGWSKAFVNGAAGSKPATLALGVCWVTGCIAAALAPAAGARGRASGRALTAYAVYAVQVGSMVSRIGGFRWTTAALFPLHCLFFCTVFAYSALRVHVFHSVRWKGRSVGDTPAHTRRPR